MVKLFFKPLQGLRGRGVEPHIRKGLLQNSLRKQGLKRSETPFGVSDTFPAYKNTGTLCGAKIILFL